MFCCLQDCLGWDHYRSAEKIREKAVISVRMLLPTEGKEEELEEEVLRAASR